VRRLPFAHGVGARRGTPGTREAGRWRAFRGSRFSMARNGCDRNLEKIGGTENPEGAPLRPGSPRAMRERERQSPGRFRADARQGESNERSGSNEDFAELRRSDTKEGVGLPTRDASKISGINVEAPFFLQAGTLSRTLSPNPWDLTLSRQNG